VAYRCFISYRSDDASVHAGLIYDEVAEALEKSSVFLDVEHIVGFDRFSSQIHTALNDCAVFILVIGRRFVSDRLFEAQDVLRMEIETALSGGKRILPVLVDGASVPNPASLPSTIRALTDWQSLSLDSRDRARYHADIRDLVDQVVLFESGRKPSPADEMGKRFRSGLPTTGIMDGRRSRLKFSRDERLGGWGNTAPLAVYVDEEKWPYGELACGGTIEIDVISGRRTLWLFTEAESWNPRMGTTTTTYKTDRFTQVFEPGIHSLRVRHRPVFSLGPTDFIQYDGKRNWWT